METLTLTELSRRTARRWRTLVVGACVGLAAGVAMHVVIPTRFEAVAVVRVDAADPALVDMAAEEALASSRRVSAEALDALGEPQLSIDGLEQAAAARSVDDSRVLHVTYRAPSPEAAARGADAVSNAYLAVRSVDDAGTGRRPTSTAEVVDPARTPAAPVGPGGAATSLAGLVLGLLLAVPPAARPTRSPAARAS